MNVIELFQIFIVNLTLLVLVVNCSETPKPLIRLFLSALSFHADFLNSATNVTFFHSSSTIN